MSGQRFYNQAIYNQFMAFLIHKGGENSEFFEDAQALVKDLLEEIQSIDSGKALMSLQKLLQFPSVLTQDYKEEILQVLRDQITFATPFQYANLVLAINTNEVLDNRKFYYPILGVLANNFSVSGKRLPPFEVLKVFQAFSSTYIKNFDLYNQIMEKLESSSNSLSAPQLADMMRCIGDVRIVNHSVVDRVLQRLPTRLSMHQADFLIKSLNKMGYRSSELTKQFDRLFNPSFVANRSTTLVNMIKLVIVQEFDNEEERI